MTKVICGFPGIGKSFITKRVGNYVDLNSSKYKGNNFVQNYVDDIEFHVNSGKADYVFVSCHREVRAELANRDIDFILIYPSLLLKEEYLERYRSSGKSEGFINLMERRWTGYIVECAEQTINKRYILKSGKYLSDALDAIESGKPIA